MMLIRTFNGQSHYKALKKNITFIVEFLQRQGNKLLKIAIDMNNLQIEINNETTDRIDDLSYESVSPKYRSVQTTSAAIAYALLSACALFLLLTDNLWLCIIAETVIVVSFFINLLVLRKAYQFKGYALREHDITYRSGVIFPKITTVPFTKIQQVSISQNPISKYFGLCAIDVVNGAQSLSSLVIQGLTKEKAEKIKNVITQRLNNDND